MGVERFFAVHQEFPVEKSIVFGRDDDATDAVVLDGTDELFVRMTGAADGSIENCLGTTLLDTQIAIDHYYVGVAAGTENIPSLYCSSRIYAFDTAALVISGSPTPVTQPLVGGVENMQILYGLGDDTEVTRYVDAATVADWRTIRAVKVALLSASNENTAGVNNSLNYVLLDKTVAAPGDRRPRMVFQQTVSLRNYIP
jgi:hypothetical protein